jgi:Domain of unknown function (DUF1127)
LSANASGPRSLVSPGRCPAPWRSAQCRPSRGRSSTGCDSLTRRRQAAAERALLSSLDARTLRDIGLGDWAVPHAEDLRPRWDDASSHRF